MMTNNPTIDGVSRELFHAAACRLSDLGQSHISEPMFAILLDAPAVERQPIKNASEVAYNLQAENARLEARITQLESDAATYQTARDRIAELESGRSLVHVDKLDPAQRLALSRGDRNAD